MEALNNFLQQNLGMDLGSFGLVLLVGFCVGLVARLLLPGRDPAGIITTSLIGVAGSFLGNYGAHHFGLFSSELAQGETALFFRFGIAVAGAMVILLALKLVRNA